MPDLENYVDVGEVVGPAGADATINGVNALTLAAGDNVTLSQSGATLTMSVDSITQATLDAAIDAKISSVYKAGGSATLATLPALSAANLGLVCNMSESFTTTSDFVEGAGKTYPAGSNVVIALIGSDYRYDVLSGFVDLSGYAHTADVPTKTSDLTNDSGFLTAAAQSATDAAQNSRISDNETAISEILAYLQNMAIYRTASGNPATFSDGRANAALSDCVVTLVPTQSGSGVPSPENLRPIVGYSSVSVTRTDADGAASVNAQTVAVTFTDGTDPLTVYGGIIDIISGTLTVTHGIYTFTGTESWLYSSTTGTYYSSTAALPNCVPRLYSEAFDGICDGLASYDGTQTWQNVSVPTIGVGTSSSERNTGLRLKIPSISGQANVQSATAGLQVVYPLATPLSYNLTPVSLTSLSGYNSVTADAGTLSVTYRSNAQISPS